MQVNRTIRNTIIGLTSLIGSSNVVPKTAIPTTEKLTNKITVIANKIPSESIYEASEKYATDTLSSVEISTKPKTYVYKRGYTPLPLEGTSVMINPGHGIRRKDGTMDYGKVIGKGKKAIREADINDKVAENVRRKLQKLGATVIYVDNTDVHSIKSLQNQYRPDVFVAIHHDAKAKGRRAKNSGETIFGWGELGRKLAQKINIWYKNDSTIPNNGINSAWAKELCVLKADPKIPAVLIEGGFMTNQRELKLLNTQDYQNIQAQNIVQGIRDFITTQRLEAAIKAKAEKTAKTPKMQLIFEKITEPYKLSLKTDSSGVDI